MNRYLSNIERYKTEKIRVPVKKTLTLLPETRPPTQSTQSQEAQQTLDALVHSTSILSTTLKSQESMETPQESNIEFGKMESFRSNTMTDTSSKRTLLTNQRSVDLRSIISNSKSNIPIDDDKLLEVEVSVPHLNKMGSQTIADNTLFINFLARQQTFIDQKSLKARVSTENKKKDLKSLAQELSQKHIEKKSENVTIEVIQSRFQVTDLKELEAKRKKAEEERLKAQQALEDEEDEKDDDYNPDDLKEQAEEDEFTFQGEFEGNKDKVSLKKKPLGVDDIQRLEEGEEEGEDKVEYDDEERPYELEAEEDDGEEEEEEKGGEEDEEEEKRELAENEEYSGKGNSGDKYGLEKFNDVQAFGREAEYDSPSNSNGVEEGNY